MAVMSMEMWWDLLFLLPVVKFYVPGVDIKAVKLTSSCTQVPYNYNSLPFCRPELIMYRGQNLGKVLHGVGE
uniref:Transmembrane 9 superfamily member n=1 Tax=Amphilophus citrinellus TaxID=61819 RepID=A0A3Q0S7V9_AMPCI